MRKPKNYEIPAAMWRSGGDLLSLNPCLRDALGAANYAARFSVLLHLEEMAEAEQVARYEMRGVALERRGGFLSLEVPGLAEMRPSLLMGDCALVQTSADGYARVFEGPIEEVRSNSILMLFDQVRSFATTQKLHRSTYYGRVASVLPFLCTLSYWLRQQSAFGLREIVSPRHEPSENAAKIF